MRLISTFVLICLSASAFCQNDQPVSKSKPGRPDQGYGVPVTTVAPQFKGGEDALKDYIIKAFPRPNVPVDQTEKVTVPVAFVVDKTGKVKDIRILKSIRPEIDKSVKNMLESMPAWNPGTRGGFADKMNMYLPLDMYIIKQ